MIKIHKNPSSPDAIADNIKLMLGDILEERDDIPMSTTFDMLAKNMNFQDLMRSVIKMALFVNSLAGTDKEFLPFSDTDINATALDELFVAEVFFILGDLTRQDFITHRKGLFRETRKENPNFLEV